MMMIILLGVALAIGIYFYMQSDNKKESVKEQPIKEGPTFIEADKFSGGKKGYVFKMDSQGLGYYLDKQKI